mgnify:CR=1 FL=1
MISHTLKGEVLSIMNQTNTDSKRKYIHPKIISKSWVINITNTGMVHSRSFVASVILAENNNQFYQLLTFCQDLADDCFNTKIRLQAIGDTISINRQKNRLQ